MGIMICDTHGRTGFIETCRHVGNAIDSGKVPHGHHVAIVTQYLICDDCYVSLGFERFESLADCSLDELAQITDGRLEAAETAYDAIEGRRVFCPKCVADLERQKTSV